MVFILTILTINRWRGKILPRSSLSERASCEGGGFAQNLNLDDQDNFKNNLDVYQIIVCWGGGFVNHNQNIDIIDNFKKNHDENSITKTIMITQRIFMISSHGQPDNMQVYGNNEESHDHENYDSDVVDYRRQQNQKVLVSLLSWMTSLIIV